MSMYDWTIWKFKTIIFNHFLTHLFVSLLSYFLVWISGFIIVFLRRNNNLFEIRKEKSSISKKADQFVCYLTILDIANHMLTWKVPTGLPLTFHMTVDQNVSLTCASECSAPPSYHLPKSLTCLCALRTLRILLSLSNPWTQLLNLRWLRIKPPTYRYTRG